MHCLQCRYKIDPSVITHWPNKNGKINFIEVTDTIRNIIDKLFPFKNRNCQQDWLALYDGPGLNSTQIGKYCGTSFPVTTSSGRWLTLEFVTNTYTSGAGFKLNYNFTTSLIRMYNCLFVCLYWGLTSQSTIFQSCRDGANSSWV